MPPTSRISDMRTLLAVVDVVVLPGPALARNEHGRMVVARLACASRFPRPVDLISCSS